MLSYPSPESINNNLLTENLMTSDQNSSSKPTINERVGYFDCLMCAQMARQEMPLLV